MKAVDRLSDVFSVWQKYFLFDRYISELRKNVKHTENYATSEYVTFKAFFPFVLSHNLYAVKFNLCIQICVR